jgi:hypothetical protein
LAPINQKENYSEEKTTTQHQDVIINPDPVILVVVFEEEEKPSETIINSGTVAPVSSENEKLKFPDSFTDSQIKDAKRTLKRLEKPELATAILLQLAADILSGIIRTTIPRYLGGLVKTANENGHFTRTQAAGASNKGGQPRIPVYVSKGQSTPSKPEVAKGFLQQARSALRGVAI